MAYAYFLKFDDEEAKIHRYSFDERTAFKTEDPTRRIFKVITDQGWILRLYAKQGEVVLNKTSLTVWYRTPEDSKAINAFINFEIKKRKASLDFAKECEARLKMLSAVDQIEST